MYGKRYHPQRKRNLRNANSTTPHREGISILNTIEIVTKGNELLLSDVPDTNTR